MGHDIIINGVPISEDALREMLEMLERQNTSDGDEPGACIRSEHFEWTIDDDGNIIINKMWRGYRWLDVSSGDMDEMPTEEEDAARWKSISEMLARNEEKKKKGNDAEKLLKDFSESLAAQDRRISWAHFVLHNPRATEEQRREAAEILDSIPDYEEEKED